MTFFQQSNRDAYSVSPDAAASGPLVGFMDSFNASVEAQMRTSAQYGIEYFMQEQDWQQTKALLDAGVDSPPQLMMSLEGGAPGQEGKSLSQMMRQDSGYYEDFLPERSGEYLDVAKKYTGGEVSSEFEERLRAYDERIAKLREERPELGLRTSGEMFDKVREDAVAAETAQQSNRRTWGGTAGDFLGGALSSMHPGTDPLNFYSAGIGGLGKTVAQRIMFQVGAQGAVETLNQVTGVQDQRRMLGLSHGLADAAMRVGSTAVGAGILQGAGEAVAAGAKRWFRSTPNDPAPPVSVAETPREPLVSVAETPREPLVLPPPERLKEAAQTARLEQDGRTYLDILAEQTPLSGIRAGRPRAVFDIGDATRQLEDWTGGSPASITPRTADATFPPSAATASADVRVAVDSAKLYAAAARADPETFAKYDKLLERKNTYRRWMDELAQGFDEDVSRTMSAIDQRLHSLEARLRTTQGKNAKAKLKAEIADARADRTSLVAASQNRETPDIAQVRRDLVKLDENMRDLAPLIGRAYSRARGRWGETTEELDAVWNAYREGRQQVEPPVSSDIPDVGTLMSLSDRAPVLRRADQVEPGRTSADTAQRVIAENSKVIDDALTAYRQEVKDLVSRSEDGKLRVEGRDYEFDLDKDKMFVPNEEGTGGKEVSMREFLEDTKRADEELEAISTCSIR